MTGANHTPRLSMSKASSRSTSGAGGTGARRSAALTACLRSALRAEQLALLRRHLAVVARELLPGDVAEGEQRRGRGRNGRGAEPAVEPPAEEGEDRGGHGQLHGRRQRIAEAVVELTLGGEIEHRRLGPRDPRAGLATGACEYIRNLEHRAWRRQIRHPLPSGRTLATSRTEVLPVANLTVPASARARRRPRRSPRSPARRRRRRPRTRPAGTWSTTASSRRVERGVDRLADVRAEPVGVGPGLVELRHRRGRWRSVMVSRRLAARPASGLLVLDRDALEGDGRVLGLGLHARPPRRRCPTRWPGRRRSRAASPTTRPAATRSDEPAPAGARGDVDGHRSAPRSGGSGSALEDARRRPGPASSEQILAGARPSWSGAHLHGAVALDEPGSGLDGDGPALARARGRRGRRRPRTAASARRGRPRRSTAARRCPAATVSPRRSSTTRGASGARPVRCPRPPSSGRRRAARRRRARPPDGGGLGLA